MDNVHPAVSCDIPRDCMEVCGPGCYTESVTMTSVTVNASP